MSEVKEFTLILSFDLSEFDESKLTKEYVERVAKKYLEGKGVQIKAYEGRKFRVNGITGTISKVFQFLRDVHCVFVDCKNCPIRKECKELDEWLMMH